jgi:peptidoglycan hydrolase-like protein with peptidoglycan-binding domain
MTKKLLTLVATAGLGIAGLAATAGTPADAAQPQAVSNCSTVQLRTSGSYNFYVPTSGGNPGRNCQMSRASHSQTASTPVRNLQVHMNDCNRVVNQNPIKVDGYFGKDTYDRLRSVQDFRNVKPIDGIYGRVTHNGIKFVGSFIKNGTKYVDCLWDAAV